MPPGIIKNPYEHISSSDHALMLRIDSEYQRAFDASQRERERSFKNWRAYMALEGGRWENEDLAQFKAEDRTAAQYNVIGQKTDTLAGSLSLEEVDLDWKPIGGVRNSLTEAVKSTWYTDKELCGYPAQEEVCIRDAMVLLGTMKMQMTDEYDPLHNICFKRTLPGHVVFDPNWITDDDKDCERAWEIFHLSPIQIADNFGVSSPKIDEAIKLWRRFGGQYEEYDPNFAEQLQLMTRGHLYRVIEHHWIEKVKMPRVVGQVLNSERWLPFPITKERELLEQFMIMNKIDPNSMMESIYTDRIHKVATICPQLTHKLLEHGVSKIQVKRLPYFQFTANRGLGKNKGIVDDMMDIQDTINRRESKLTDLVETAQGGGKLVNRDLFRTPQERERFKAYANDPKYIEFVDGEELSKEKAIHYINSNQYPSQIINQLERMWDIIDRVSKVPAAMEAMSESSNESGVLFNRKLQAARMSSVTIMNRLKKWRRNMAEAYFWQWQLSYNGPERNFSTNDGKYNTTLNKRVYNEKEGRVYIENRPDMIPRCTVIATESKASPNQVLADQAVYSELYNISAQTNPDYANLFFHKLLMTANLDEETKEHANDIALLQRIRDRKKLIAEVANFDATEKQALLVSVQAGQQLGQSLGQLGIGPPQGQQDDAVAIAEDEIPQEPTPESSPLPEEEEQQNTPLPADVAQP